MALTEKQLEEIAACGNESIDATLTEEGAIKFTKAVIATLPKPEAVAVVDANDDGYWADILPDIGVKVGQLLYTEAPIAQPASAPSEQKPVYQFRPECENWIDCTEKFYESWRGVKRELYAAPQPDYKAQRDINIEAIDNAIAEALGEAYDCTRVWSAWSYGTMGPDDFQLVSEDPSRIAEIRDAILASVKGGA